MNVRGSCVSLAPTVQPTDRRSNTVYINHLSQSRITRIAWSYLWHPVKCREFPAKQERLITADELVRYGV
jgi:hypothetical protein